jgi:single-stranded DNA-binding protein
MPNGIESAFQGRLGADAIAKESGSGKPMLTCRVAVGSGDAAQWIGIVRFGRELADLQALAGRMTKGSEIYCEGRLAVTSWEKAGQPRMGLDCVAWRIEPLGEIGQRRQRKPRKPAPASKGASATAGGAEPGLDDEIPF